VAWEHEVWAIAPTVGWCIQVGSGSPGNGHQPNKVMSHRVVVADFNGFCEQIELMVLQWVAAKISLAV